MTGYLDRLVQRAAGQSPSALTPRRRSRYEDAAGDGGGLQVVDAEHVAPPSSPSAEPAATSPNGVAERGERASTPATPTPSAAPDDRRDRAAEPWPPAVHDLRADTNETSDAPAGGDQVAATGARSAPRPAPVHAATARAVPAPSAPATATSAADSVTAHAAVETTPVAHDVGRSAMVATTRLASSSSEPAPQDDADATGAADIWRATPAQLERGGRRRSQATAAAASEPVVVEVTIGRIEIRAVPDPAPAVQRTSAAPPLSDYLRDRARTGGVRR